MEQHHMNAELDNSKFQKSLNNYIKNANKKNKKNGGVDMIEDSDLKKPSKGKNHQEAPKQKKNKVNFNDLSGNGDIEGDEVYEGQK
jgi:hypothetical protein